MAIHSVSETKSKTNREFTGRFPVDPQLGPYFELPDHILQRLLAKGTLAEMRVYLAISRAIYIAEPISLQEVSSVTHLDVTHVKVAVNSLCRRGMLRRSRVVHDPAKPQLFRWDARSESCPPRVAGGAA